jgi:hypothetical protein
MRQTESVSERSPDNRSKKWERDKYCGAALLPWNRSQEVLFLPFGDGKAAMGMQRENIAVNRLCTGNGSTEAE